jgi:hypothetical protein
MNYVRNFLAFWYDFIVGDAWEVAGGVLIALVVSAILASSGLRNIVWLILPLIVGLSLTLSLIWYARKR